MDYHAHIYWHNEDQRRRALFLRYPLEQLGCELGRICEEPIGPHPQSMYQASYNSDNAQKVEELLAGSGLDILLHEDTGDDVRDHTQGARWLGNELKLDLVWLQQYADERKQ